MIPCYGRGSAPSEKILHYGRSVNMIMTAVGPSNLLGLSEVLAGIAIERARVGIEDALNIILIENLTVSGEEVAILKDQVMQIVESEFTQYVESHVGFVDTVIETTIMANESNLDVMADRLDKILYVNSNRVKGDLPNVQIQMEADILPIRMRKLFVHNFADTAVAYLGARYGHEYIHEAVEDPRVFPTVDGAFREIRRALSLEFSNRSDMTEAALIEYINEQKARLRSTTMRDKVSRIARDPIRKLRFDDRFVGPARLAKKHGITPINLIECIKAALDYWLRE